MILVIIFGLIVKGNKYISTNEILKAIPQGIEAIYAIYKNNGFINVKIEKKGDTIFIEEGEQFKVGKIKILGNTIFNEKELLSMMKTKHGKIFNEKIFIKDMEIILKKYANNGYPFCEINPFGFELNSDKVNFGLKIIEGELIKINNIKIMGNNTTKDYVIKRETRIKKGEIYREEKIDYAKKKILLLNFIDSVEITINNDELTIYVKERKANFLSSALGYSKKELAGMFNLNFINLFGTARKVNMEWNNTKNYSVIKFRYTEPWAFNLPIKLEITFLYKKEDFYKKKEAQSIINIPITPNFNINFGKKIRHSNIQKEYLGILGMNYQTTKIDYKIKTEFNKKGLQRYIINLNNFINPFFLGVNFCNILQKVPIYEQFKIGGAKTLRGFNEEEFSGKKVLWANIEPHISYFLLFYDIGYIDKLIKQSYGIGLSILDKKIKIYYGIEKGAPFIDGKIHIIAETHF